MSLLTMVQYFARRTNLAVPTTVTGSTDDQVNQIKALLEEEGNDLAKRGDWQEITFEALHTTVATESQGAITAIATNGFNYIKHDTFWDRTENLPVLIYDGVDWQAEKGFAVTGPRYHVRLRGNELLANPVPVAGNTWAFEYVSKNWIVQEDGTTYLQYFAADTDTALLPEDILLMGLRWRWKKEKGFDYAEDFRTYEMMLRDALSRNGLRRTLNMSKTPMPMRGIIVNQGNWDL